MPLRTKNSVLSLALRSELWLVMEGGWVDVVHRRGNINLRSE